MAAEWRGEQARCQREIDRHQEADKSYMNEGVQILELARKAQQLFERQEPRQKRRLLNFLLSNCTWEDGGVVATFHRLIYWQKPPPSRPRQRTMDGEI
jgi:site-specific DNA recombinase